MNRAKLVVAGAVAALVVWGALRWFFPDNEKLIRRQLRAVAAAASIGANEAPLERLGNAGKLCALFTPAPRIRIEAGGRGFHIEGRESLFQTAMAARANYGPVSVEVLDAEIELAADRATATAQVALRVRGNIEGGMDFMELEFRMVKRGRRWLVSEIRSASNVRL